MLFLRSLVLFGFLEANLCLASLVNTGHFRSRARIHKSAAGLEKKTSLSKRSSFTWFYDGLGACGETNVDSDYIVALSAEDWESGAHCFETITITIDGASTTATIMDQCPGCASGDLDFSLGLFEFFADSSVGVLDGSWTYSSDTDSSDTDSNDDDTEETTTTWQAATTTSTTEVWVAPETTSTTSTTPEWMPTTTSTYSPYEVTSFSTSSSASTTNDENFSSSSSVFSASSSPVQASSSATPSTSSVDYSSSSSVPYSSSSSEASATSGVVLENLNSVIVAMGNMVMAGQSTSD